MTRLTDVEHGILRLLADGCTYDEIAEARFVERSTVKTHLARIYRKLGAVNGPHAVHLAWREQLLS